MKLKITKEKILNTVLQTLFFIFMFYIINTFLERNMLQSTTNPAPYFSLKTLESIKQHTDHRVSLSGLRGKKTILYFFAPWCSVCKLSMPNLEKIQQRQDVNVIAIALDYSSVKEVDDFIGNLTLSMPILLGNRELAKNYRIDAFPSYYVLNEDLTISARSRGYSTELGMWLRL